LQTFLPPETVHPHFPHQPTFTAQGARCDPPDPADVLSRDLLEVAAQLCLLITEDFAAQVLCSAVLEQHPADKALENHEQRAGHYQPYGAALVSSVPRRTARYVYRCNKIHEHRLLQLFSSDYW
jgi:hypothetical protein